MGYKIPEFIKDESITLDYDRENKKRWKLSVIINEEATESIVVILKNPSTAGLNHFRDSDVTANRVINYIHKNENKALELQNIKEVIILNLIPHYETKSKLLKEHLGKNIRDEKNLALIKEATKEHKKVIVAWGKPPSKLSKEYDILKDEVLNILKGNMNDVFYVGSKSKWGDYPRHAQSWGYKYELKKYSI